MSQDDGRIIEVEDVSLSRWLELLSEPPDGTLFVDYQFPTEAHLREYVETVADRSEEEVRRLLLRLLIPSTTMGCDKRNLDALRGAERAQSELHKAMIGRQYYQRLESYSAGRSRLPPWEGITWILDLLPHFPGRAIETLNA